jgi:cell division protein FtsB
MTRGKARKAFPLRLMIVLLLGLVLAWFGARFVQQVGVSLERRAELDQIDEEISIVQQETARLEDRLTYVQSPEAAEEWARGNGWAKQDEVSIAVVAPSTQPSPDGGAMPGDEARLGSNRETWWDLFFAER